LNYCDLPDTDHAWNEYTLSYEATAADTGQDLILALYGRGATHVDDVILASSAPEATSLALGMIGLAGLALAGRWRKRTRAAS
jgi:MYXO-CTERM domain-containing protein